MVKWRHETQKVMNYCFTLYLGKTQKQKNKKIINLKYKVTSKFLNIPL